MSASTMSASTMISFRAGDVLAKELEARRHGANPGIVAKQLLSDYLVLLEVEFARAQVSSGDLATIAQACPGLAEERIIPRLANVMLWTAMEEAGFRDLAERLRKLTAAQAVAVLDRIRRV